MNLYAKLYESKNSCNIHSKKYVTLSDNSNEVRIIGEMARPFRYGTNHIGSIAYEKRNGNYIIKDDNRHMSRRNECFSIIMTENGDNIYIPKAAKDYIQILEILENKEPNQSCYMYVFTLEIPSQKNVDSFDNYLPIWIGQQENLQGSFTLFLEEGNVRISETKSEVDIWLMQLKMENRTTMDNAYFDVRQYISLDMLHKKKENY